jgi:chromosome segregation ATPase
MNFKKLIKRADDVDKAFQELQTDLAEAFDACLDEELPLEGAGAGDGDPAAVEDNAQPLGTVDSPESQSRLSPHTQTRLAALSAVDGLFRDAQGHLDEIAAKLSELASSHHLTREFLGILHGDVLRANEMELANAGLSTEQKTLSEQLAEAARRQRERDGAYEALQQRESSLVQERETLRAALSAVRLELVEAANAGARREAEFGDIATQLSAKTVEANRRSSENKVLREKQVSQSIDLDQALKREAEVRHKLDEISAIHAGDAARIADLGTALARSEKEEIRLQKALESAQSKLQEETEAARAMEADREAELARNLAEMRGLRSEIQDLQSRLEHAGSQNGEAVAEIARLKVQLGDALAEKQIADERLSVLKNESESYKMSLSAVNANLSQLSLQQASEQIELDIQKQECEDLRAEVATLNARIQELLPYERLHRVTAARTRNDNVVEIAGVVAETARATHRRRARRRLHAAS